MKYAKAIVAALTAGIGSLIVAASDGHLTLVEWLVAALATLAALGATYSVPNEPAPFTPSSVPSPGNGPKQTMAQIPGASPAAEVTAE